MYTRINQTNIDGFVKSPSVRLRRRAFYFAMPFLTFYKIVNIQRLIPENYKMAAAKEFCEIGDTHA
jgi:hypothetical protein